MDRQVAERLQAERARIANEEARKAKIALGNDLQQKAKEVADLQEILKEREGKLAEAQKAQAEVITRQRELEDARRELDLTVAKRVQEGLDATRLKARKDSRVCRERRGGCAPRSAA